MEKGEKYKHPKLMRYKQQGNVCRRMEADGGITSIFKNLRACHVRAMLYFFKYAILEI
jgi:hypothetical protein